MLTATPEPKVQAGQLGVGDVNIAAARALARTTPPNPNAALDQFVGRGVRTVPRVVQLGSVAGCGSRERGVGASGLERRCLGSAAWSIVRLGERGLGGRSMGLCCLGHGRLERCGLERCGVGGCGVGRQRRRRPAVGDRRRRIDPLIAGRDARISSGIVDPDCDPTIHACCHGSIRAAPARRRAVATATHAALLP